MPKNYQSDIDAIQHIAAVPTILDVVCQTTGMGFAAVARVTQDRWIACNVRDDIAFGLKPGGELKVETTICHEIRQHREPVIINHVAEDDKYRTHQTPAMYGFQSYISMPIILPDGSFFGTLCAIDPRPARLNTPQIINMFKLFAELIAFHLNALEKVSSTESQLLEEQETSQLRDQFIAVLGHDLRNPLSAIISSAPLLMKMPLNERGMKIVGLIQESAARMHELIENVLDFARGRMGSGLVLERGADKSLEPMLRQVIAELSISWPKQTIETEFALDELVYCDQSRIAQLFSNLLGNALIYGEREQPIRVVAKSAEGRFTLSVANSGNPISPAAMQRLFHPFSRGEVRPSMQGLGLGLYIVSEIAKAHSGVIEVASNEQETRFTFTMPTRAKEMALKAAS